MNEEAAGKKPRGLLSRAEEFIRKHAVNFGVDDESSCAEKAFLSFHRFAQEFRLHKAGVFISNVNSFDLTVSHGLESETLKHPETPAGFWENAYFSRYDKNNWVTLRADDQEPFLPLFSQVEQEEILALSFKTFAYGGRQFILCILDTPGFSLQKTAFTAIETSFTAVLPIIAGSGLTGIPLYPSPFFFEEKIHTAEQRKFVANKIILDFAAVFAQMPQQITLQDKEVLSISLYNCIAYVIGSQNICLSAEQGVFLLVVFSHTPVQAAIYADLLKHSLEKLLNRELLMALAVTSPGTAEKSVDILTFLHRKA